MRYNCRFPFSSRISLSVRRQIYDLFMAVMQPTEDMRVLDIGITDDIEHPESNFFEQWYPWLRRVACVSTESTAINIGYRFPAVGFYHVPQGEPLPFSDKAYDIAFSNAVIEHVGGPIQQLLWVREACRVAKRVFLATPNRWCPVELHTGLPFLHWLPQQAYHLLTGRDEVLLSRRTLTELLPGECRTIGPLRSNLVVWT